MNSKELDAKKLTRGGIVIALYVVLSNIVPGLSFGPIQFRFSEILTLLAFVDSFYVLPLTLACAIANLWSPFGMVDVVFGSLSSFLALYAMTKTDNINLASIFPALASVMIGMEIFLLSSEPVNFFLISGQIMLSQFIIVALIGLPIFKIALKNEEFKKAIIVNRQ